MTDNATVRLGFASPPSQPSLNAVSRLRAAQVRDADYTTESEELFQRMREAGFRDVEWASLRFSVACLHTGRKAGLYGTPYRYPG